MKASKKLLVWLVAPLFLFETQCFTAAKLFANESAAPKTMTKIVARDISHFVKKGSFNSKPKTLYRAGLLYARLEGSLDTENNSQVLVIVNEPSIWTIDQVSKTGQILKDTDGEFHVPVWSGATIPETLEGLEYGQEFDFFKRYKAGKTGSATVETISCDRYDLTRGKYHVVLFAKKGTEIPVEVRIQEGADVDIDEFYDSYEAGLLFAPSLFQVPGNIKIASAPKAPGSEWQEFKPEDARCSVLLPDEAKKVDAGMPMWDADDSQGHSFNLSYYDIPKPVTDLEGFFGYMAKGIESTGSKVDHQKRFSYKGFPVCEFEVHSGNDRAKTRVCLVNQRVYILTCGGETRPATEKPGQLILEIKNPEEKFFSSLEFIHPELNKGK